MRKLGIYINSGKFPKIYTNETHLIEPNQTEYKMNDFVEMLGNQRETNKKLQASLANFQRSQNHWNDHYLQKWEIVDQQFSNINKLHLEHKFFEEQLAQRLKNIEINHSTIQKYLSATEQLQLTMKEQVNLLNTRQTEMNSHMKLFDGRYNEISKQQKQTKLVNGTLNKKIDQLLKKNDEFEKQQVSLLETVTKNEEHQVIIMEKINSLDHKQNEITHHLENVVDENQDLSKIVMELQVMNTAETKKSEELASVTTKIETQLEDHSDLFRQFSQHIANLEEIQKEYFTRFDQYEGLIEKVILHLEHLNQSFMNERMISK